jgi:hypothetical protein
MSDNVTLTTTMRCPACGQESVETMPTNRFVFFWECPGCKTVLRPKDGDCCVYLSYGDRPCPFVQKEQPWFE